MRSLYIVLPLFLWGCGPDLAGNARCVDDSQSAWDADQAVCDELLGTCGSSDDYYGCTEDADWCRYDAEQAHEARVEACGLQFL